MDKPFNHLIICLTFVMPVAALSGCSGPNDSPEQDAVMSISSCTARGDDGQEMSVSEFGMFVTDTAGNLYPDNIRVLNRSGKWTFAEISLSDGDKGIYAYYPYNPSFSGGKMGLDARSQTDYLYSERTMVSGNAPSASITLYHLLSKVTFRNARRRHRGQSGGLQLLRFVQYSDGLTGDKTGKRHNILRNRKPAALSR